MPAFLRLFRRKKASSLVTTLFVVTVLTVIVVAFLQSMTIERMTSKSYANIERARLAAEAGVNAAVELIQNNSSTENYLVLLSKNPNAEEYYYLGQQHTNSGTERLLAIPLFTDPDTPVVNLNSLPVPPNFINNTNANEFVRFNTSEGKPASVRWVYLNASPTGSVTNYSSGNIIPTNSTARYGFWVEDLSARINILQAGNTNGSGGDHLRAEGTNYSDIALFTIFNPATNVTANPEIVKTIVQDREKLKTNGVPSIITSKTVANLLSANQTGLLQDFALGDVKYSEVPTIPFGFGYTNSGKRKFNLNEILQSSSTPSTKVNEIAKIIKDNLPLFDTTNRFGAFPASQNYLKTLAANIVDYADTDNSATVGSDYRGFDSYPMVSTCYYQFRWVRITPGGMSSNNQDYWFAKNGTWHCKVEVRIFLQLWNMTNQEISSGTFEFDDSANNYSLYAAGTELPIQPPPAGAPAKRIEVKASPANSNETSPIRANEFRVLSFGPIIYEVDTGTSTGFPRPNLTGASRPRLSRKGGNDNLDHIDSSYAFKWNTATVDRPLGKVEYKAGALDRDGAGDGPDWRGFVNGLRYDAGFPTPYEQTFNPGDPRSAYYINTFLAANDYDENSSWWGRHFAQDAMSNSGPNAWFGQETRVDLWPDPAKLTTRGYSIFQLGPAGTSASDVRARNAKTPFDIPSANRPTLDSSAAPVVISNNGTLRSITELGRIYDPIQWRPSWPETRSGDATIPKDKTNMENGWLNIDQTNMTADARYVLPGTLRIGRGEYQQFTNVGLKAYQLLDIFDTEDVKQRQSSVNINTATTNALRALVAGLKFTNAQVQPINVTTPGNSNQGDFFADAVIAARPFYSVSQLSGLTNTNGPIFGNTNQWKISGPTFWPDEAREEFFSRIYELASVKSRFFRIHSIGQGLNSKGQVTSTHRKSVDVLFKPTHSPDGGIESLQSIFLHEIHY